MQSDFHYLLKFIVVGDTGTHMAIKGVGKSCVVMQFVDQKINDHHQITIGVQFASRTIKIRQKNVKFQVWDTAGQQNFRSITRSYYRSAIGAFLVYDITKRKTFEHLQQWLRQIKLNGSHHLQIIIIGNKNDLQQQREVTPQEGKKFAESNNLPWMQLSAKNYDKVEGAFIKLATGIVSRIQKGQISETTPGIKICQHLKIDPLFQKKKSCC